MEWGNRTGDQTLEGLAIISEHLYLISRASRSHWKVKAGVWGGQIWILLDLHVDGFEDWRWETGSRTIATIQGRKNDIQNEGFGGWVMEGDSRLSSVWQVNLAGSGEGRGWNNPQISGLDWWPCCWPTEDPQEGGKGGSGGGGGEMKWVGSMLSSGAHWTEDGWLWASKTFDLNHEFPMKPTFPKGVEKLLKGGGQKQLNTTTVCSPSKGHSIYTYLCSVCGIKILWWWAGEGGWWVAKKKTPKKAPWEGDSEPKIEKHWLKLWFYCRVLKAERELTSLAKIEFGARFEPCLLIEMQIPGLLPPVKLIQNPLWVQLRTGILNKVTNCFSLLVLTN